VILISSRASSFLDPLWPPMEARGGADEVAARVGGAAARGVGIFERVEGSEVASDQHGVRQRPQMLGGLELGRIRREQPQVDVLGHAQLDARRLPARAIQDEDELFGGAGTDLTGAGRPVNCEEGEADEADRRGQMKDRATGGGMDEADEGAPVGAVLDRGRGGAAAQRNTRPCAGAASASVRCGAHRRPRCPSGRPAPAGRRARRPGRAAGWVFFAGGLLFRVGLHLAWHYAAYGAGRRGAPDTERPSPGRH
jgi:hypothetical protein